MNPPAVSLLTTRSCTSLPTPRLPLTTGTEDVSLSRYFPAGTLYFYGYPAGQDSRFYNRVLPLSEELVSARSLVCAGDDVLPIVYPSAVEPRILALLRDALGVTLVPDERILTLPESILADIVDDERNRRVRAALRDLAPDGSLIMAQPYTDPALRKQFQLPVELTISLNDKVHLRDYIPAQFLPERFAVFPDGLAFTRSRKPLPLPCVVKVSSSCSGDGVRICRTAAQLHLAKREYAIIDSPILVQDFVDEIRNFSIQFGIPHDPDVPIELIGVSEQLTTPEGEFIGGIVDPAHLVPTIDGVNDLLLRTVLPNVRSLGWYGVGGFDVLVDRQHRFFITDPNFRMTGMTPYLFDARNGKIRRRMVSFTGRFDGSDRAFREAIVPLARAGDRYQLLHIIALTRHGDTWRMNAAMLFDEDAAAPECAAKLLHIGIASKALEKLRKNGRDRYPDFPRP